MELDEYPAVSLHNVAETVPADMGFEPRLDRDHHPFP